MHTFAAYLQQELQRIVRKPDLLIFTVALPGALYLMFGTTSSGAADAAGHGNTAAVVMTSMALYGAAGVAISIAGAITLERQSGWVRQLRLAGLSQRAWLGGKIIMAALMATFSVLLVFSLGAATGSHMDGAGRWAATVVLILVAAAPMTLFGLAMALVLPTDSAIPIASGLLVVFSFLGNLFVPLHGALAEFSRFTPMYGSAILARWPQLSGEYYHDGMAQQETLTAALFSIAVWSAVWALVCVRGARRMTAR